MTEQVNDKYAFLRAHLPELVEEAAQKGAINPRAQMIIDLLTDYDALHAEAEALRAENERLAREAKNDAVAYRAAIERQEELRSALLKVSMDGDRLRAEMEAARGLLDRAATCMRDAAFIIDSSGYRINGAAVTIYSLRSLAQELTAAPAAKEGGE